MTLLPFFSLEDYAHKALFEGCQYPWEALERLQAYLSKQPLGKIEVDLPNSVYLINPESISIGANTTVEPGVYIQGPCIIGAGCSVRHGAYIRGDVITGDGCVIGHDTEVKHSIFLNRAMAAHFNYVGDSILGNDVNLGAGVKCANLRLDHECIRVSFEGKRIVTRIKKLGAMVGDGAQVGCNCVINPGTILGRKSFCFPCLNIDGHIPDHAKVKPAMKNSVE